MPKTTTNALEANMYKQLVKKNGLLEEAYITRDLCCGNPRDPECVPFRIEFKTLGGDIRYFCMNYKDVKTLAQNLQEALHMADREYMEECEKEEDDESIWDLACKLKELSEQC